MYVLAPNALRKACTNMTQKKREPHAREIVQCQSLEVRPYLDSEMQNSLFVLIFNIMRIQELRVDTIHPRNTEMYHFQKILNGRPNVTIGMFTMTDVL